MHRTAIAALAIALGNPMPCFARDRAPRGLDAEKLDGIGAAVDKLIESGRIGGA